MAETENKVTTEAEAKPSVWKNVGLVALGIIIGVVISFGIVTLSAKEAVGNFDAGTTVESTQTAE